LKPTPTRLQRVIRKGGALKPERAAFRRFAHLAAVACLFLSAPSGAETAWVKDEHQINVRSGAGVKYRVIGVIETGDSVEILDRAEEWTQVRSEKIPNGWIRAGFLQESPPARLVLAELEAEKAELEQKLASLTAVEAQLRADHEEISQLDSGQRAEIERLTHENIELGAGARWAEWLTGAGIVLFGMLLGAIVSKSSGRRRQQRIKL
jgi:hypothetical protein